MIATLPVNDCPKQMALVLKRLADVVIAALLTLLLSPLLALIALLIAVTSPGPLLYRQRRVGQGGSSFLICKFRTMYPGSDKAGPLVTSSDDQRVTPTGRWLRAHKIDELPQLFNVLKGDMSLVGPRPQVPRFVEHFDPALRAIVLSVRPGITGPTSLYFRHEEDLLGNRPDREQYYIRTILPLKLAMDARAVQTWTPSADISSLWQTGVLLVQAFVRRVLLRNSPKECGHCADVRRDLTSCSLEGPTVAFSDRERRQHTPQHLPDASGEVVSA